MFVKTKIPINDVHICIISNVISKYCAKQISKCICESHFFNKNNSIL